jgi:L-2-hydroxyglutarate oxidase LhgO
MDSTDALVVGAGVVGLACARALARAGLGVVVVESAAHFGAGVSSRNSEVVHAGLYGEPGSLKASLCVQGRALLYEFCGRHHVAHRRCGKLVVATRSADEGKLLELRDRGLANGVDDLALLTGAQAQALEPELACSAALLSPSSGIVDSHGLMTALLADAEAHGALLACHSGFVGARAVAAGWQVKVAASDAAVPFEMHTRWLVNAAGLDTQAVAAAMQGFPAAAIPRRHLAKGHYFAIAARSPFSRLVYPTPVDGGLGVHLTLDLAGQARFGPDVQWLDSDAAGAALDYAVDASRLPAFEAEVRRYWPRLPAGAMTPAYSGIRPKLSGPGEPAADFRIDGPGAHGCAGVVQLFGIESPGLTASLAIAERVAATVARADGPGGRA